MKPYFLPLKKEYYEKFKAGTQNCEIRPAGHRGWNQKNIVSGRGMILSCGYGTQNRLYRTITTTVEGPAWFAFMGVPQWHRDAVEKIYGQQDRWLVAYVNII